VQKPVFTGLVQSGAAYILIDDVITTGGTIAALREFVVSQGGRVVAVVALAYAIGSHDVAPKKWYIVRLLVKFGRRLLLLLQMLGVAAGFEELTNMQARYLLRFASVQNMERKLAAA
jgi:MFS family permease